MMPLPTKPSRPTSFKASLSASTEELPWAMLAKGPAWTNTGVPCNNQRWRGERGGGVEKTVLKKKQTQV